MAEPWEIKQGIEDAIRCLEDVAGDVNTEAAECDGQHQAMNDLSARIEAVLVEARKLLPLHPDFEAEIDHHEDEADRERNGVDPSRIGYLANGAAENVDFDDD